MSEQNFHKMIRENSTSIKTLEKISQRLKIPMSSFFDDEGSFDRVFIQKKAKVWIAFEADEDQEDQILRMVSGRKK